MIKNAGCAYGFVLFDIPLCNEVEHLSNSLRPPCPVSTLVYSFHSTGTSVTIDPKMGSATAKGYLARLSLRLKIQATRRSVLSVCWSFTPTFALPKVVGTGKMAGHSI